MGHFESSAKRKVYDTKYQQQPKKLGKFHKSSLKVNLEALELKEANSPRRSRHQEIIKLRAEINKT